MRQLTLSSCIVILLVTGVGCEPPSAALPDAGCTSAPSSIAGKTTPAWEYLGLDEPTVSSIQALAVHPIDAEILFAGSISNFSEGIQGKLFHSTDGGASWDTLLVGGSFQDVQFDPQDPETVYALPHGIVKSTDGGATWSDVSEGIRLDWETRVASLAIDPLDSEVLYAGTAGFFGGALYKSTDGGSSWQVIVSSEERMGLSGVISLAIDPSDPKVLYAGTAQIGAVYKSTDAGMTWTQTGLGETGRLIDFVSVSPPEGTVYSAVRFDGVFRSHDGGMSWQEEIVDDGLEAFRQLLFSPSDPSNLYLASNAGIYWKGQQGDWSKLTEQGLGQVPEPV